MASEAEVRKFIEENYKYEVLDGGYKMLFGGEGERSQLVFAMLNSSNMQVWSPFASIDDVTPKQALTANYRYTMGMQLIGSTFVVYHHVPFEDVDASEIKTAFALVAGIADDLEKDLVGGDKF